MKPIEYEQLKQRVELALIDFMGKRGWYLDQFSVHVTRKGPYVKRLKIVATTKAVTTASKYSLIAEYDTSSEADLTKILSTRDIQKLLDETHPVKIKNANTIKRVVSSPIEEPKATQLNAFVKTLRKVRNVND